MLDFLEVAQARSLSKKACIVWKISIHTYSESEKDNVMKLSATDSLFLVSGFLFPIDNVIVNPLMSSPLLTVEFLNFPCFPWDISKIYKLKKDTWTKFSIKFAHLRCLYQLKTSNRTS